MSFNRSGYIGRAPGDSAITIAKQYFQPTSVGKTFTFSSGYDPGLIDVYRNGIKLINVLDYAATDGSTIVLDTPVGVGSTVQVVAYKAFNLATVKATELDTSVTGTDLTLSGDLTVSDTTATANLSVTGVITATTALHVGSALTANAAGDVETIGIITAASFSGDGTGLSGVVGVGTLNVRTESLTVSGVSTLTGVTNFASAVNVDATTDSTSVTTGALIVDGGLAVAKNVYIGAGLSVAGTLTYEDVTSVDSVGLITAKSGVNITGGEFRAGIAVTIGSAGVTTFSNGVHLDGTTIFGKGNAVQLENGFENENAQIVNDGATEKATIVFKTSSGGTVSERLRIKDTGDVDLSGSAAGVSSVTWDASADSLIFKDSTSLNFGNSNDLQISHTRDLASQNDSEGVSVVDGWTSYINENGTGGLVLKSNGNSGEGAFQFFDTGWRPLARMFSGSNASTKLYQAGLERFATTSAGINVTGISSATQSIHVAETIYADGGTGIITATQYKGDGSALTGVGGEFDITSCLFI